MSRIYLRQLRRSFVAALLFGTVLSALIVIAILSAGHLLQTAGRTIDPAQLTPFAAALVAALVAAAVLHVARATLLNRHRAWIDHALGQSVVAHEILVASDRRQRARSLAAVTSAGSFSPLSAALADALCGLVAICVLWYVSPNIATVASLGALACLATFLFGLREHDGVKGFDQAAVSHSEGEAIAQSASQANDSRPETAAAAAARWEAAQRARIAALYANEQRRTRRNAIAASFVLLSLAAFALVILMGHADDAGSLPRNLMLSAIGVWALSVLARLVAVAPRIAEARAGIQHLRMLRRDTSRVLPRASAPDLRLPVSAGLLAAAAAAAAFVMISSTWNLVPSLEHTWTMPHAGEKRASTVSPLKKDNAS